MRAGCNIKYQVRHVGRIKTAAVLDWEAINDQQSMMRLQPMSANQLILGSYTERLGVFAVLTCDEV